MAYLGLRGVEKLASSSSNATTIACFLFMAAVCIGNYTSFFQITQAINSECDYVDGKHLDINNTGNKEVANGDDFKR